MEKVLNELCVGLERELGVPVRLYGSGCDANGVSYLGLGLKIDGMRVIFEVGSVWDGSEDEGSLDLLRCIFSAGCKSLGCATNTTKNTRNGKQDKSRG